MQTLKEVLEGDPAVSFHYRATFVPGYGLTTWLMLPASWWSNGAAAARIATWLCLVATPPALHGLARSLGRPSLWPAVLGAQAIFGISYWYGFLPTLFAVPGVLAAWASHVQALKRETDRGLWSAATAALGVFVGLCHLTMFGALAVGMVAISAARRECRRGLSAAVVSLLPGTLLIGGSIWRLADRAKDGRVRDAWSWDFYSHLAFVYRAYGRAGRLDVILSLVVVLGLALLWLRRRHHEPAAPAALFWGLGALYLLTPKAIAGAWLVHVRLLVLMSSASALLVSFEAIPRWVKVALGGATAATLLSVAIRHWEFSREIDGLRALLSEPPSGPHGGLSLRVLPSSVSRMPLLEHLPQWWTATWGGTGHHFFADADHQPVRFIQGRGLPHRLAPDSPREDFDPFSSLLVFGPGELPSALAEGREVRREGSWRRIERGGGR